MAGVRNKPEPNGKFKGWYYNAQKKRKHVVLTRNKSESLRIVQKLEDEHRQVRLGYRPVPNSANKHKFRPFCEMKDEYLAWGKSQGGRGGRPWGATHARMRCSILTWWEDELGLETLTDLEGILPRVEKELRNLQRKGRAPKTVSNYAEALAAFCDWGVQRGYLASDPLESLGTFDQTPQTVRRAMTSEEIIRLLEVCSPQRRLLLETAFLSGLRANELRNLTLKHLDLKRGGLHLDARWTKNREPGFQPLPIHLLEELLAFAKSGEPTGLYSRSYRRKDAILRIPRNPLLYVPTHTARELDKNLKDADIPKYTPDGKVDFHACRVAFINLLLENGASIKEAQTLARHSTPQLTMNVYVPTTEKQRSEAVEKVGEILLGEKKRALCVPSTENGQEQKRRNPDNSNEVTPNKKWWRRRESNPRPSMR